MSVCVYRATADGSSVTLMSGGVKESWQLYAAAAFHRRGPLMCASDQIMMKHRSDGGRKRCSFNHLLIVSRGTEDILHYACVIICLPSCMLLVSFQ